MLWKKKGPIVRYFLKILNPLLADSWAYERLCEVLQYRNLTSRTHSPNFTGIVDITPENLTLIPSVH